MAWVACRRISVIARRGVAGGPGYPLSRLSERREGSVVQSYSRTLGPSMVRPSRGPSRAADSHSRSR